MIVSVALANLVVSVSEVAVIVTLPLAGTTEGAVYVVNSPWGRLNDPHAPVDPHEAVQITPALNGSLVTEEMRFSVALICREAGTAEVIATPIGDATMVRLSLLLCAGLLVTVAVTVIAPPIGATDGAV